MSPSRGKEETYIAKAGKDEVKIVVCCHWIELANESISSARSFANAQMTLTLLMHWSDHTQLAWERYVQGSFGHLHIRERDITYILA